MPIPYRGGALVPRRGPTGGTGRYVPAPLIPQDDTIVDPLPFYAPSQAQGGGGDECADLENLIRLLAAFRMAMARQLKPLATLVGGFNSPSLAYVTAIGEFSGRIASIVKNFLLSQLTADALALLLKSLDLPSDFGETIKGLPGALTEKGLDKLSDVFKYTDEDLEKAIKDLKNHTDPVISVYSYDKNLQRFQATLNRIDKVLADLRAKLAACKKRKGGKYKQPVDTVPPKKTL